MSSSYDDKFNKMEVEKMIVKEKDILMPIEVAGVEFRNPFHIASGPASRFPEQLVKAQECGWAGASIKLTFDPAPYINLKPRYGWFKDLGYLSFSAETKLNIEEGLRLIEEGRRKTKDFILLANITYSGDKGLKGWASRMNARRTLMSTLKRSQRKKLSGRPKDVLTAVAALAVVFARKFTPLLPLALRITKLK